MIGSGVDQKNVMGRGALVLGSSVAALQAACDLADSGIPVHLVEPSPFIAPGSSPSPEGDPDALSPQMNARLLELAKHPNVRVWTQTRIQKTQGTLPHLRATLSQHPRYIDLTKCTACGDCIEVCPVTVPGTDHKAILLPWGGQPNCAVIEKIGRAPCSATCPGGIHAQGYVALVAKGRFQEAIDLIREAIPFPGICGRICTHPCELNCRRAEVDTAVGIRPIKRFLADWEIEHRRQGPNPASHAEAQRPTQDKRVAIVGAGPGGMAVAHELARMGYPVTVFDKLPVIGGMMAVGIPVYRLPREVIAGEYQAIEEMGVEIRLNTAIGPGGTHSLEDLSAMGYQAVCLAIGAHKSREMRIAGEDLTGVVHGIDLLRNIGLAQQLDDEQCHKAIAAALPRGAATRVAVLGGGNTAMDVSRSLRRLGVQDVRILYRRSRAEMPASPEEIEGAEEEGVQIDYLVSPLRIIGDDQGRVIGLECQRMVLGEPDESGRRRPRPIADSEFVLDLDLIVPAIGQAPDMDLLGPEHGLGISRAERIVVDPVSSMTQRPGVFASGDAVTTDKMVVIEVIGMGKRTAQAIDAYLNGREADPAPDPTQGMPVSLRLMSPEELAPKPRVPAPVLPLSQRLDTYAEVELAYTAEQAIAEASRCLACGPCSECLACVVACKPGAILHEQKGAVLDVSIGAVIHTGASPAWDQSPLPDEPGFYRIEPDSPLSGSAAAARVLYDLLAESHPAAPRPTAIARPTAPRVGVFVCQCGDQIARTVDTERIGEYARHWPDVAHAQTVPFSCSPQGAEAILQAVDDHRLSHVVLAACSCCAFDQVCFSCTFQRIRCKDHLGIFATQRPGGPVFEFVNIREQCAWPHTDDPQAATAKATALIAGAVAKVRLQQPRQFDALPVERSVAILGHGPAAQACRQALEAQGIAIQQPQALPEGVLRAQGHYALVNGDREWTSAALVLAPTADELDPLLAAVENNGHALRLPDARTGVDTQRPGVFFCPPSADAALTGQAAAARAVAWLGRVALRSEPTRAVVDPARCRACNTCVEICEFGAPQLVGDDTRRTSWIDPALCTGCGTCAAHCPSGAISAGYSSDGQLEAMLEQILGDDW